MVVDCREITFIHSTHTYIYIYMAMGQKENPWGPQGLVFFPFTNRVFPQTGSPVRGSYSFETGACSGHVIWRLSLGLFSCKRHSGFSECFGPHDFALVSHLSPTTLWVLCPHDFRLVSHLSSTSLPVH